MARSPRFTVYDVMSNRGDFEKNAANPGARNEQGENIYEGPVQYPKMMFHPKGEERVLVPAEVIVTPMGPKSVGEQRELIYKVVNSELEEEALKAKGWHSHPAAAIAASGKAAPSTGADHTIADLKRQIAHLEAQKAALEGPKAPGPLAKPSP